LSAWLTVEPPYRLAEAGQFGMRPGDPAATIDPDTGALDWLPVNGTEHAQIGHIELRTGRLDAAHRRFDEAAAALPPESKADWMFFRAVALQKAGRDADAKEAMRRFEPPASVSRDRALISLQAAMTGNQSLATNGEAIRPRHRFAAEAFLSLDMATEGIEFFHRELRDATSDTDRLSAVVVLCQLLLLTDRRAEYAEQIADQLLPLAGRVLPNAGPNREAFGSSVAITLLPLAVSEFCSALPEKTIRRVTVKASAWVDLVCQLMLRTCGRQLRDAATTERASARLAKHAARPRFNLPADGEVNLEFLMRNRTQFLMAERLGEVFGVDVAPQPNR
jgi:hypothetical protein